MKYLRESLRKIREKLRRGGQAGGQGVGSINNIVTHGNLPDVSLENLKKAYHKGRGLGAELFADEIRQEIWMREQANQTNTIRRLTWWICVFTMIVVAATILQVAIALKWIGRQERRGDLGSPPPAASPS